jgi:FMN reductase
MKSPSIVGISGNVTRPSRTAALVSDIADRLARRLGGEANVVELVDAAPHLLTALTPDELGAQGRRILDLIEHADVLVAGTPVYRASMTGAFKHLFDLVDQHALVGKPVVLAATGGSLLHGLVTEHQLRPLFSFFNALTLPTTIYAVSADFERYRLVGESVLDRVARVVEEAAAQLRCAVSETRITNAA